MADVQARRDDGEHAGKSKLFSRQIRNVWRKNGERYFNGRIA